MCYNCTHPMQITVIDGEKFFREHPYVTDRPQDLPLSLNALGFLDSLPSAELSEEHYECPICQEILEAEGDVKMAPCGHTFHRICLGRAVDHTNGTCPICRRHFLSDENNENSEGTNAPGGSEENVQPDENDSEDNDGNEETDSEENDGGN
ncbi:uncharacterized protein LOC129288321 [Prosopis cineraria]|uniref:uncharacterized protein LOC129288321 n=1 Tax=Prosopis cineraria TaxID=364024 RepID=UPI0024104D1E|nr:uncharacterized protein LOC129288321 [Prosopis cineraria]